MVTSVPDRLDGYVESRSLFTTGLATVIVASALSGANVVPIGVCDQITSAVFVSTNSGTEAGSTVQ